MTAKEKAKELVDKFINFTPIGELEYRKMKAKEISILCVDEILKLGFLTYGVDYERKKESQIYFWEEVREEINNLLF